jgi:hypothetical protein
MKKKFLLTASVLTLGLAAVGAGGSVLAQSNPTSETLVEVVVNSTLSISSDASGGTVSLNVTPLVADDSTGGTLVTGNETITVTTNNPNGYTLTIENNDSNLNLVSGSDNIAASTAPFGTPAALSASGATGVWGFRLASFAADTFAGVPANGSPQIISSTSAAASGDTTVVTWGVAVTTAQPAGTYSDTVIYTVIDN